MSSFDQTPDEPESFGYKVSWFALKASDPAQVVDALELGEATPANWASGLAAACSNDISQKSCPWLFVSPPVSGWVFVISFRLPYPAPIGTHQHIGTQFDVLFSRLMKRFDDVQFFGSDRVSDFVAWARAINGRPTRIFAYADGQVLINIGDQTQEEAKLGFANLSGLSPEDASDEIFRIVEEQETEEDALAASGLTRDEARERLLQNGRDPFPNEDDVVELAALWSVDPTRLPNDDHQFGLGLAARLPQMG